SPPAGRGEKSSSFRGASKASEPGIHNHDREYGFRACAKRRIPERQIQARAVLKQKISGGGLPMSLTRRNILAAAGAAAATTLLSRTALAQSFPFTMNQRYPDPA